MLKKSSTKKITHLRYYAVLREQRGVSSELVKTEAQTAFELYNELKKKYHFSLATKVLRIAINSEFKDWSTKIKSNDEIIFVPPVAGG